MRRRSLFPILATLTLAPAWAFHGLAQKFDPNRDAQDDLDHALTMAQAQGKLVFVDLGGEWCTWCHIFDRFVAAHPEVKNSLDEKYVVVKVNYSPQNRNEQLLSRWPKAKGYPHFYILDAGGRVLHSQASAELEAGNDYDEAKMLALLRRQLATA
jgi:thiol:disulfide interchange protein